MPIFDQRLGKFDDDRMFCFDYKIDKVELLKIYNSIPESEDIWPFFKPPPKENIGCTRRGFNFREIEDKENPNHPFKRFPYIEHLYEEFNLHRFSCNLTFVVQEKNFSFLPHVDGRRFVPNDPRKNYTPGEKKHTTCGVNFILNDEGFEKFGRLSDPAPLSYTQENQIDLCEQFRWVDIKTSETDDYHYHYESAILNALWTHYVVPNGNDDRLFFRISILDLDFKDAVAHLKNLGL